MKKKLLSLLLIAGMIFAFAPQHAIAGVEFEQDGTRVDISDHANFTNGAFTVTKNGLRVDITPGYAWVVEGVTVDSSEYQVVWTDPTTDNAVTVLEGASSFLNYYVTTSGASMVTCNTARKGALAVVTDGTGATDCTTGGGSTVNVCFCSGSTWTNVS